MEPKKRKPVDDWYFQLLIIACDERCCSCGKHKSELEKPFERGHIKAHVAAGDEGPENIIPVCRPCNRKYAKADTPCEHMPLDATERLAGLLLLRLLPKLSCSMIFPSRGVILTTATDENTRLIDWQNCNFGLLQRYIHDPRRMTTRDAHRIVNDMITATRRMYGHGDSAPLIPSAKRQSDLCDIVLRLDHQSGAEECERMFKATFMRYLRAQEWVRDGRVLQDSFGQLVDGFNVLHGEQKADDAARQRKDQENKRARARERWRAYKQAADVGDYAGMTAGDRAFRDAVRAENELRDVSDEEIAAVTGLIKEEFRAKKLTCDDYIALCAWLMELQPEECDGLSTEMVAEWLRKAKSIRQLLTVHAAIVELHAELKQYTGPQPTGDPVELF